MGIFAFFEAGGDEYYRAAIKLMDRCGLFKPRGARLVKGSEAEGRFSDVIVAAPGFDASRLPRCRVLVIPGDAPIMSYSGFDYAVTYGMSPRDTVTLSSVGEDRSILAVQRELVALDGTVTERQEIPLTSLGLTPGALMAASAVTLLSSGGETALKRLCVSRAEHSIKQ